MVAQSYMIDKTPKNQAVYQNIGNPAPCCYGVMVTIATIVVNLLNDYEALHINVSLEKNYKRYALGLF